ncbi:MAG TPA: DUF4956 domain-containing protein [Pyrinomonadaceae bacterium]|jgi:uncharacterized membrane protein YhiD involved in acid resistance|nr:DUF4956 domain-containing protein [Pyrinomonadaceae bacterium]
MKTKSVRTREITTLVVVFAGVLLISAFAVYLIGGGRGATDGVVVQTQQPTDASPEPTERRSPTPNTTNETFVDRLFGTRHNEVFMASERWAETMGRLALRLLLAALLGAALAYRPRKRIQALKPNPYVSQTQILLAIVAAALMIIVGDNAARAFGIFAAVSLVRFRTNIRDPKEITVLLISLALGLASGVGRWDLALILTVFSLLVLWLLEWREPQTVFRSMELKVTTRNVMATQQALRTILQKHGFDKELRSIDRDVTEESPGSLAYSIDVSSMVSTDELSEEILRLDGANVEGIEWDQKKSYSYLYQ